MRDAARLHRCVATILLLVGFALVGAYIGWSDARRVNAAHLATLREAHLQSFFHDHGGDSAP